MVVWEKCGESWCPKGIRPIIPKQQIREYVYAYAAVAPQLGQMTSLVLPYANTKMMNLFLAQVAVDLREYFIIIQVDKAASHIAQKACKLLKIFACYLSHFTAQN